MSSSTQGVSHPLLRKKSLDKMIADSKGAGEHEHLQRSMGTFQLMMFGVGATIGTGIFFVLAETVPDAGPAVVISFLFTGIVAGLTALCYAEVASTIPVSGSAYSYAFATLGELPAYLIGWCLILEYGVAAAATAVGWSEYFNALLDDLFDFTLPHDFSVGLFADDPGIINVPAVILVVMCCLLLVRGAKESAAVNAIMVVIKLGVLAMFIAIAFTAFDSDNLTPFNPYGFDGIGSALPVIFFTYIGLDAVSTASEEVKDPAKTIPKAIIGALLIVTTFYCVVALAAIGAQSAADFSGQEAGLAAILEDVTGSTVPSIILSAGAVISIFSVTLVVIYGQTRILFAMGRDGLLPPLFKNVNETLTPVKNTLVTGGCILVLAAVVPIDKLFDLVSIGTLAAFATVSATVIILRQTRPDLERGFRVPLGPVIPLLSIAACIYVLTTIPAVTWSYVIPWLVVALLVYFFYSHKNSVLRGYEWSDEE